MLCGTMESAGQQYSGTFTGTNIGDGTVYNAGRDLYVGRDSEFDGQKSTLVFDADTSFVQRVSPGRTSSNG